MLMIHLRAKESFSQSNMTLPNYFSFIFVTSVAPSQKQAHWDSNGKYPSGTNWRNQAKSTGFWDFQFRKSSLSLFGARQVYKLNWLNWPIGFALIGDQMKCLDYSIIHASIYPALGHWSLYSGEKEPADVFGSPKPGTIYICMRARLCATQPP